MLMFAVDEAAVSHKVVKINCCVCSTVLTVKQTLVCSFVLPVITKRFLYYDFHLRNFVETKLANIYANWVIF